jgi:hypothetical protein
MQSESEIYLAPGEHIFQLFSNQKTQYPGNKNQQETKALAVLAIHNQSTKALS